MGEETTRLWVLFKGGLEFYYSINLPSHNNAPCGCVAYLDEIGTRGRHIEQHLLCRLASGSQQPPHHVVETDSVALSPLHHYLPIALINLGVEQRNVADALTLLDENGVVDVDGIIDIAVEVDGVVDVVVDEGGVMNVVIHIADDGVVDVLVDKRCVVDVLGQVDSIVDVVVDIGGVVDVVVDVLHDGVVQVLVDVAVEVGGVVYIVVHESGVMHVFCHRPDDGVVDILIHPLGEV